MTRDEAKEEWTKVHPLDLDLDGVIDVIYDYFEKEKQELINKYSELSNKYTELKLKGKE